MEDLFKELIQGSGQQPSGQDATPDPLSGILQGLLGGGAVTHDSAPQATGGLDMASLLQALLGGGAPGSSASGTSGAGAGGLGDILGAILGGGSAASAGTQEASGATAGGLGEVLGAILGGANTATQSDPFTSALASMLSEQLGLPPQIAHAVVVFVLGKLLHRRVQAGSSSSVGSGAGLQGAAQGLSLDGLLSKVSSGGTVTKADVRATGMARELAANTGLDRRTAEASLQQVLNALGGQVGGAAPARTPRRPQESGLDSMLDGWPK